MNVIEKAVADKKEIKVIVGTQGDFIKCIETQVTNHGGRHNFKTVSVYLNDVKCGCKETIDKILSSGKPVEVVA